MRGTIAITDYGWYDLLRNQQGLEEVNFWKPSATRGFTLTSFRRLSLSYELPTTPSVDSVSLRDTPDWVCVDELLTRVGGEFKNCDRLCPEFLETDRNRCTSVH